MDRGSPNLTGSINGTEPPHGEESDSDQDSSSSVYSMSSGEIENHFVVRYNRRFHSPGNGNVRLYPLPVDDAEVQRLNRSHELIKELLGGRNYWGPPPQSLVAPINAEHRVRILDVCTGNGKWVDEMAAEFPQAKVYGLDIENVQFEIHDINTTTRWAGGRFDIVHTRQIILTHIHYPAVLREVARILRPGGLFLAGEWLPVLFTLDGSRTSTTSNGVSAFLHLVSDIAGRRGLFHNTLEIPRILMSNTYFENVVAERRVVPLDGSTRADRTKRALLEFADAAKYFLRDSGISATRVEDILQALRRDLNNASNFSLIYLTVHARRKVYAVP
ncbi:S-adenosyl-L-methionine-dependent methyltransferase [Fomitiporia mediterranea MF3/22]|uniref:S-adenosyl-L-methionine-dependent methyltransferase n=1 Tax=Fomitiporia mediterranea (strain MF3/22) TaxID=694068 RepID=UPI00044076E2|nr:S-adenosyl-L-methionine-dependent methyltransferase [Fomitiporia mediterranea MF3/22]EJD04831.1 S-adenosyl-L-methionine-dependent methyltransferase [Fomitiporia mediterranea MF3/22]